MSGDLEQGCPRHAPGDQEQGAGAAGDDLGQERDRGSARERGQDGDLMGQLECGRTRPGELHEELVTEGLAARVPLRVLFAGQARNRERIPAQLWRHDPQGLAESHGRALCQPRYLWGLGHVVTVEHPPADAKRLCAPPGVDAPPAYRRARPAMLTCPARPVVSGGHRSRSRCPGVVQGHVSGMLADRRAGSRSAAGRT